MKCAFNGRVGLWVGVILTQVLLQAAVPGQGLRASAAPASPETPAGQRIFVCGHSFQSYMGDTLEAITRAAGITNYRTIGVQNLGGSEISKHWDLPDEENKVKSAIDSGVVDVLLLSSAWKGPDPAIESFTRLLLAHNARGRVLVMASWPGYDLPDPHRITDNAQRDGIKVADIRTAYVPYYQSLQVQLADLHVALTADKTAGSERHQAIFLVPIGPAVIGLRERIAQGKVPGIAQQAELFADALGHPRWPVKLLAGYCEFAVIYQRSPVGLPMHELPDCFVKTKDTVPAWSTELNRVLQEVAWEAVQQEPLCGLDSARLPKAQQDTGSDVAAAPRLKKTLTVDLGGGVSMDFVLVPPGSFQMGSEMGYTDEKPVHKVTITKPFYIGKYEVTQEQWQAVMGANPSSTKGPKLPVTDVSWEDCRQFAARLAEGGSGAAGVFRLPTEAEWEYACRAGTTTAFSFGDNWAALGEYAWFGGNSGGKTHEVGTKKPNAWGLYDMHGNVSEWCADWHGAYTGDAATDPNGPARGAFRLIRSGGRLDAAAFCRSAQRQENAPGYRLGSLGCRVVLAPAVQP